MEKIKVGIIGYGNLGKGVEKALLKTKDMELIAVFSRRDPKTVQTIKTPVISVAEIKNYVGKIDVMVLCGGSATDLMEQTKEYVKYFNVIDSFDTHAKIPEHFKDVDEIGKQNGTLGAISIGWDPGLFSMMRTLFASVLPSGEDYTFWGKGVSQGHSDAIRRIEGVLDAKQYTVPIESAVERVRKGENPALSTREKHKRECYVVLKEGADAKKVENEIKTMPNYFADYDTTVHFISMEEFKKNHASLPHGGFVLRSGDTGENKHVLEFSLKLDSNPEFTASVLVAFTRAVYVMRKEGKVGAITCLDVPLKYLSETSYEELIKHSI